MEDGLIRATPFIAATLGLRRDLGAAADWRPRLSLSKLSSKFPGSGWGGFISPAPLLMRPHANIVTALRFDQVYFSIRNACSQRGGGY